MVECCRKAGLPRPRTLQMHACMRGPEDGGVLGCTSAAQRPAWRLATHQPCVSCLVGGGALCLDPPTRRQLLQRQHRRRC